MRLAHFLEEWKKYQEVQRSRPRLSKRLELVVVTIILVGMGWTFIEVKRSIPVLGKAIPVDAPLEKNRAHAPSGASIVLPERWKVRNQAGPQLLWIAPESGSRRLRAWIIVETNEEKRPLDLEVCRPVRFRGAPAVERMDVVREGTFDEPANAEYRLHVEVKGQWYTVRYFIAERRTELPEMVRAYLETVRLPGEQLPIAPK